MKSVNSFKMTGVGGMSYADATGDAPAAMNGVVVVCVIWWDEGSVQQKAIFFS